MDSEKPVEDISIDSEKELYTLQVTRARAIKQCTIHNGLTMAGFDNDTIAKFCKAGGGGEYTAVTDAYPMLQPISKPRTHADGVCIEGYKIK